MNPHCFKLFDIVQFHLIGQMLPKFSGVESERTVFKLRKRKRNFCVVFAYSIKPARRATAAEKCTKKRDAHPRLSFC